MWWWGLESLDSVNLMLPIGLWIRNTHGRLIDEFEMDGIEFRVCRE